MPDAEHTRPRVAAAAAAAQAQAHAVAAAYGAAAAAAAHQRPFTLPSSANHFTHPGAPPFAPPYASPHAAFAPQTSFGTVAPHFGYAPGATSAAAAAAASAAASVAAVGAPAKKARKPYTITRQRENWTAEEHQLFLEALKKHGRDWKQIEGCVKTKNVIQVRSHAQKYFNRVKKNKTGEHIPPPRPKRKNSVPGPPTQPLAQAISSDSLLPAPPLSLSYPASSSLLKPTSSSHAFSPAASSLMPTSASPLTRAPSAPLSPSFLQMQNALNSNLVAREAQGADALDRGTSLVSEAISSDMTAETGLRRSLSTRRNLNRGTKRQPGTPPVRRLTQPKVPRTDPIGISHRKATGLASYTTTPLLSGTQYSGVIGSPMSVETATAATPQSCPNFAKIYAFFANLFDPHRTYDSVTGMHAASLTALDKEIIKLLITNLETNISNEGNRKELLETYRTQISSQQT